MTRLALVTGGAKRLGRELVLHLLSRDWDVIVHYFSSGESALCEIEERAKSLGRRVVFFRSDLSTREGVDDLVEFACHHSDHLELLVNNASYFPLAEQRCADSYISNESEDEWDYTLALNARAPFFLMQKLASLLMKNREAGSNTYCNTEPEQVNRSDGSAAQSEALSTVINILDTCIDSPFVSRASYSVSKAALLTTTELAARTLRDSICIYGLVLGELDFSQPSERAGSDELVESNTVADTVAVGRVMDALGPLLANELPTGTIVRITQ